MNKPLLTVLIVALALCGVAALMLFNLSSNPQPVPVKPIAQAPAVSRAAAVAPRVAARPTKAAPAPVHASTPTPVRKPAPIASTIPPAPAASEPDWNTFIVPLPMARFALASIGTDDPLAEAVWLTAINDPTISPSDRQDLIEDLNEEGFADPDNPTLDELPFIEARLAVIDRYSGDAMDNVNAAAFQEARKDLIDMRKRLTDPSAAR